MQHIMNKFEGNVNTVLGVAVNAFHGPRVSPPGYTSAGSMSAGYASACVGN